MSVLTQLKRWFRLPHFYDIEDEVEIGKAIEKMLGRAEKSIRMYVPSLYHGVFVSAEVVRALEKAAQRGLQVQLLEDSPGALTDWRIWRIIRRFSNVEFRILLGKEKPPKHFFLVDSDAVALVLSHLYERITAIRFAEGTTFAPVTFQNEFQRYWDIADPVNPTR